MLPGCGVVATRGLGGHAVAARAAMLGVGVMSRVVTSKEFNQNASKVRRLTEQGPVIITDQRGQHMYWSPSLNFKNSPERARKDQIFS